MHGVSPLKKQGQVKHFGGLQLARECTVYTLQRIHISHVDIYKRQVSAYCAVYTLHRIHTSHIDVYKSAVSAYCAMHTIHTLTCLWASLATRIRSNQRRAQCDTRLVL